MIQPTLFRTDPPFDGDTFEPEQDQERLTGQLSKVRWLMADGLPRTLATIAEVTGQPPASVSARLRDLRKLKHGGYTVERTRLERGLFLYRVTR